MTSLATRNLPRVMVACNHATNGTFRGSATAFEFELGSEEIQVEFPFWDRGLRMSHACIIGTRQEALVFGRRMLVPINGYREWVGNWCWDQFLCSEDDAMRLLKSLRWNGWMFDYGTDRICRLCESMPARIKERS